MDTETFGEVVAESITRGPIIRDAQGTVRYLDTLEELDDDQCSAHGVYHTDGAQ